MFGGRLIALLELEIFALVDESILAGKYPPVPFDPAKAKPSALEDQRRKPRIEIPFVLPPEYARLAFLGTPPCVEVEEHRQQALNLLLGIAEPETYFRVAFQSAKNRPDFRPEARSQNTQVPLPAFWQANTTAVNIALGPKEVARTVVPFPQKAQMRRGLRHLIQHHNHAAIQCFRTVGAKGVHYLIFMAGSNDEIQIVGIVRTIPDKRKRRRRLTVSPHCSRAHRSNSPEDAVAVESGGYPQLARAPIAGPPRRHPLPAQKNAAGAGFPQQCVPRRPEALQFVLSTDFAHDHTAISTG